jgi:DUF438 domain-containing protein
LILFLNNFLNLIFLKEKNKCSENDMEYEKLRKFYNIFKQYYSKWIQVVQKEEKTHPYKKFERENDKLYNSFLKRTENFE